MQVKSSYAENLGTRERFLASDLKAWAATGFVVFFFTITNVNIITMVIPIALLAVFAVGAILYHRELFYFVTKHAMVVAYPAIILLSATWSTVPSKTAWYGLQLCVTIGYGILMGVSATPRQLVRGFFVAMAIVIVASVLWGRMGVSAVGLVLIGVTGGKTALGYTAVNLAGSGLAVLFDRQQPLLYRIAAVPLIPMGAYFATHVEAASAVVALVALPLAFFGFLALRYVSVFVRWALVALMLVVAVPLSAIVYTEMPEDASARVLRAFNKDATLSGRTVIWAKADEWIKQSPIVGHGFRAFWTSESPDSLGVLHYFQLTDGRGFQIHNTFRETLVDTGWLGLIILIGTTVIFLYYIISFVFLHPSPSSAFLAASFLLMLSRTPIDSVLGVFYPPATLFYACGVLAIVFFMNAVQRPGHDAVFRRTRVSSGRPGRLVLSPRGAGVSDGA